MSALLHVLLESDPHLEGDVAEGKADPPACHQLGKVFDLQFFGATAGSIDKQHVFRPIGHS